MAVLDNGLSVNDCRLAAEVGSGTDDRWITVAPIISIAGEDTGFSSLDEHLGAIANVFDFMNSVLALWTQAQGQALALDPHLYPENQKGQEAIVNQGTLAERVDITLPKKINDLDWLNSPNPLFDAQRLFDAGAKPRGPSHDHLRDATRGLA